MGELFSDVLDITIAYPQSSHPMMDMLCGRMTKIVIDVNTLAINDDLIGDYFNNQSYQIRFQNWLNERWKIKNNKMREWMK